MNWHLNDLGVAIGLGMDAMSVSASIGVKWHGPGQRFRLAWHMGLFQFMMPLIGWTLGQEVVGLFKSFATYLAAALVFGIGVKMLVDALRSRPVAEANGEERFVDARGPAGSDPTKGWSLFVLSLATSLDALIVGFSLGLRNTEIWHVSFIIGVVAALMALTGVLIGRHAGKVIGKPAELIGAAVLMLIGVSFLWL